MTDFDLKHGAGGRVPGEDDQPIDTPAEDPGRAPAGAPPAPTEVEQGLDVTAPGTSDDPDALTLSDPELDRPEQP